MAVGLQLPCHSFSRLLGFINSHSREHPMYVISGLDKYREFGPIVRETVLPGTDIVWLFDPADIRDSPRSPEPTKEEQSFMQIRTFLLDFFNTVSSLLYYVRLIHRSIILRLPASSFCRAFSTQWKKCVVSL